MDKKLKIQRLYLCISIGAVLAYFAMIIFSINNTKLYASLLSFHIFTNLFLILFTVSIFNFYKITIGSFDGEGFNDLLWKAFVTGTITTAICTTLYVFLISKNVLFYGYFSILYYLLYTSAIVFICLMFFVFKKMILYQKTKETSNFWQIFEILLYISIMVNFFQIPTNDLLFPLILIPILVMGLILSLNLRWVAYLGYKLKIKATIFLSFILIFSCIYIFILYRLDFFKTIGTSLSQNIFILSLLIFITTYALASVLVLLFNLPTSSVFEQKFSEILQLQRISGSSQYGKTEAEVYDMLLDSCLGTFFANTAVLEILDKQGNISQIIYRNMEAENYSEIKVLIRKNNLQLSNNYLMVEDVKKLSQTKNSEFLGIQSFLVLPLLNFGEKIGSVYIFSELKSAFEKEMIDIVITYVNQASASISNYRLLAQEVENARYKEEREIAKKVKKHLVPALEINNKDVEMVAISKSADDVGGDFYDFITIDSHRYAIIIGDVSGKGTSAAFSMAAMKGIFHSLIQNFSDCNTFALQANMALSYCLEKSSFITVSLFVIDSKKNTMSSFRAGHCPSYLLKNDNKNCIKLMPPGLGLGIIRNNTFLKHLQSESHEIASGDIVFAFTDGIVEAENNQKVPFGYDKIVHFLCSNQQCSIADLLKDFETILLDYCVINALNDDYTILIFKIK